MNFDVSWCKLKLRVCLFRFYCFQHTFVKSKTPKTFSEVKNVVFSLTKLQGRRRNFGYQMDEMSKIIAASGF